MVLIVIEKEEEKKMLAEVLGRDDIAAKYNRRADTVRKALLACEGVQSALVDVNAGTARVNGKGFQLDVLKRNLEDLGYRVTGEDTLR